jgi:cysteine desulfurase
MHHYMTTDFGNASSTDHVWGDRPNTSFKQVAKLVANRIGSSPQNMS